MTLTANSAGEDCAPKLLGFDVEFKERNRAGSVHLVCSCEDTSGKLSWTELCGTAEGFAVAVTEGDLAELVLIGAVRKPSTS